MSGEVMSAWRDNSRELRGRTISLGMRGLISVSIRSSVIAVYTITPTTTKHPAFIARDGIGIVHWWDDFDVSCV